MHYEAAANASALLGRKDARQQFNSLGAELTFLLHRSKDMLRQLGLENAQKVVNDVVGCLYARMPITQHKEVALCVQAGKSASTCHTRPSIPVGSCVMAISAGPCHYQSYSTIHSCCAPVAALSWP